MSKKFFLTNLNYSMANEDTSVECIISKRINAKKVFSVCGSGSRAFPLINESTEELDLIDLSELQLSFAGLREASIKNLTLHEFQEFWGYLPMKPELREKKYANLIKDYDEKLLTIFEEGMWSGPIYFGGWERTYQKLNKLVQFIVGKKQINKLIEANSIKEQFELFSKTTFQMRWKFVLIFVGNRTLFNSLLYRGHFVKKNIDKTYIQFYVEAFERLFKNNLISDSYFLQMSFLGTIRNILGAPIEAEPEIFSDVKKNIDRVKIGYRCGDLVKILEKGEKSYDMLSLSDVPSYFDSVLGRNFIQKIKPSINDGGVVIVRYYLRVHTPILDGFKDITEDYMDLITKEKVQMYNIKIYKKIKS